MAYCVHFEDRYSEYSEVGMLWVQMKHALNIDAVLQPGLVFLKLFTAAIRLEKPQEDYLDKDFLHGVPPKI